MSWGDPHSFCNQDVVSYQDGEDEEETEQGASEMSVALEMEGAPVV